jgi:hypothetical protein
MIDISRGFKQVSLHNDIVQKSSENIESLRYSIKVLKPLSKNVLKLFGVMDIPLYNELNLQKGNHIAILSHL